MNYQLDQNRKSVCKSIVRIAGSFAIGSLFAVMAPVDALAKPLQGRMADAITDSSLNSSVAQAPAAPSDASAKPSLWDLIDTVPVRPTTSPVPAPVVPEPAPVEVVPEAGAPQTEAPQTDTISLTLRLGERRVYVYRGDTVETSYPVAVGRAGWETPTGEFEVFHQLVDPGWTNPTTGEVMTPGPNNPLGDRWIAFWTDGNNSIGFHGTPNRASVGQAASHGCIRMYNEDVRELYEIVSVGTTVTVVQ